MRGFLQFTDFSQTVPGCCNHSVYLSPLQLVFGFLQYGSLSLLLLRFLLVLYRGLCLSVLLIAYHTNPLLSSHIYTYSLPLQIGAALKLAYIDYTQQKIPARRKLNVSCCAYWLKRQFIRNNLHRSAASHAENCRLSGFVCDILDSVTFGALGHTRRL